MRSLEQIYYAFGALKHLEPFTVHNAVRHYGLEIPTETLELEERPSSVDKIVSVGDQHGVVWLGGEELNWSIVR